MSKWVLVWTGIPNVGSWYAIVVCEARVVPFCNCRACRLDSLDFEEHFFVQLVTEADLLLRGFSLSCKCCGRKDVYVMKIVGEL